MLSNTHIHMIIDALTVILMVTLWCWIICMNLSCLNNIEEHLLRLQHDLRVYVLAQLKIWYNFKLYQDKLQSQFVPGQITIAICTGMILNCTGTSYNHNLSRDNLKWFSLRFQNQDWKLYQYNFKSFQDDFKLCQDMLQNSNITKT